MSGGETVKGIALEPRHGKGSYLYSAAPLAVSRLLSGPIKGL
jgi:hypothetical protein